MNETVQDVAALTVVAGAIAYLAWRFFGKASGGNCGCAKCPVAQGDAKPLVTLVKPPAAGADRDGPASATSQTGRPTGEP